MPRSSVVTIFTRRRGLRRHQVILVLGAATAATALVAPLISKGAKAAPIASSRILCGVERWPVKTLQDRPTLLSGHRTTIAKLVQRPADRGGQDTRSPSERFVYVVRAKLIQAKLESDEDIHLVIHDPVSGDSMVAELPAADCEGSAKPHQAQLMNSARQAFEQACGPIDQHWRFFKGTADVMGVLFFDFDHGQTGRAPNVAELHPVLRFRLLSASC